MSILQIPRIHFKGQISWDPIVTNNDPVFYNEDKSQTVLTPPETMSQFRQSAIEAVKTDGNWNPHGTHRVKFFDAFVSSVDLGHGLVTTDKLCGAPCNLNAMLIDLEPYGACTSQLFFDAISFGIDGGCRIAAPRNERFTARYINFSRNSFGYTAGGASVNWQTSFATAGLKIDSHKSAALAALQHALQEADAEGIVISFNAYHTIYFDDPTLSNAVPGSGDIQSGLLYDKLMAGGFQPNPARSLIVGTIGVWRKGEPMHEPGDRALLPPLPKVKPLFAAAHARLDKNQVSLDLSNSVSETGADLKKLDWGTLQLFAVDRQNKKEYLLGSLNYSQYDRAAYEAGSGIVSLNINHASEAAQADWELRTSDGKVLLAEAPLRLIPRTPNLYLDQGPASSVKFQTYKHGKPLFQVSDVTLFQMSASGGTVTATQNLQTDGEGRLSVGADASKGQVYAYIPVAGKNMPAPAAGLSTQTYTYAYVRVRAADNDIAALPATWDNVYKHVLINWNAMAPCMDNWLDLANPAQIHSYASILHRLTVPAAFESYLFMPVTRDLTAGQRSLLYKFLDRPAAEIATEAVASTTSTASKQVATAALAASKLEQEPESLSYFAQLSRSLRSPDKK
ncbi:hypothetical protein ACO0LM_20925 [Undibacterium sp. Di26W]|uniref:hypothetical protein n=1 Tax=Undibacterium sp. Di26W TaxID=3413035 RepID=UPI003BF27ADA